MRPIVNRWLRVGLGAAFAVAMATFATQVGAQISEEQIPAKDLASPIAGEGVASPEASAIASPSADWKRAPGQTEQTATDKSGTEEDADTDDSDADEPHVPEPMAPNDTPSPGVASIQPDQDVVTTGAGLPSAGPTPPPPALDLGTAASAPDLGAESLDPEIRRASSPALAASIRLTEQARRELGQSDVDSALRDLGRAVSVDPGNPFAYYYLGRTYLTKKNYAQALTFFQRAELGFTGRADWLGETLSFEGNCDEELSREPDAAKAYQAAVAAAPGNFRAQAGYGRLGPGLVQPVEAAEPPSSGGDLSAPPAVASPAPPPDEAPPLSPTDSRD